MTGKQNTGEEYYERTRIIKPLIEADKDILSRINGVFHHVYKQKFLPETVKKIGKGNHHAVFSVGQVCPPHERELYLAVKLKYTLPYTTGASFELEHYVAIYEDMFVLKKNVPYFTCAVQSCLECLPGEYILGIITEDISENEKYRITEEIPSSYATRHKDGLQELFFIDPQFMYRSSDGKKYSEKDSKVQLPPTL